MDFENIFYVILAVIYFLSRVFKKRKEVPPAESEGQEQQTGRKPISFEDLLKEFGVEEEEQKPQLEEAEVEEEDARETQSIEEEYRSRYSDEEAQSIFEKSIKEAEEVKGEQVVNESLTFKEFKPYQEQKDSNEFAEEINDLLQSEDGGKKAIVLAEILNRKY